MRLRTLLDRSTPLHKLNQARIQTAKLVSLSSISKKNGRTVTTTREPGHPPRKHTQFFYSADPRYEGKLVDCKDVRVTCSCEDFKFTWEAVLNKYGCADIAHSNGEPPLERNPMQRIGMCKHCIVAAAYIIRKGL